MREAGRWYVLRCHHNAVAHIANRDEDLASYRIDELPPNFRMSRVTQASGECLMMRALSKFRPQL